MSPLGSRDTIANAAAHDESVGGRVVEGQRGVDDVAPAQAAHVEAAAHEKVSGVLEGGGSIDFLGPENIPQILPEHLL